MLALTGFLGLVICRTESGSQRLVQDGRILRNEAGGETESQKLQLYADGILENYNYILEVEAQRFPGKGAGTVVSSCGKRGGAGIYRGK